MGPIISDVVRAILKPNKKKGLKKGSKDPSTKPPLKKPPLDGPSSSRTLSTHCSGSSRSVFSMRRSGTSSSSFSSSPRHSLYADEEEESQTEDLSELSSYHSPQSTPNRCRTLSGTSSPSFSSSFRVRNRNRALSDDDFEQLITVSCGWMFDPSEEMTKMKIDAVPTHNARLKNRAFGPADFERFIFAPTCPRLHQQVSHSDEASSERTGGGHNSRTSEHVRSSVRPLRQCVQDEILHPLYR